MRENQADHSLTIDSHNAEYVERVLQDYLRDASSVPPYWKRYFRELSDGNGDELAPDLGPSFRPASVFNPVVRRNTTTERNDDALVLQYRVDELVDAYRTLGHLAARLDPLGLAPRDHSPLELASYGLKPADVDRDVISSIGGAAPRALTLRELIEHLRRTYCGSVGFEYMHIPDSNVREWLQQRIERRGAGSGDPRTTGSGDPRTTESPSREIQLRILARLTKAVIFEEFVRKKYLGAQTFSLEGAETLIPLLDLALEAAARDGVVEVVMAMAHRGRLNVLANIVGKKPVEIFREFEDPYSEWWHGRGDVKYHLGASGDWQTEDGSRLHVSLCFNPSHLEYVNPVALGRIRAKQDRIGDGERRRGMALLIHGDAAFAGEGVVQESLNLSGLKGYATGGTLHVVVNNQLGFTTAPGEGRSSTYATDVAKMLPVPVFHVNGEYPQAVAWVAELAMDFRAKFQRDVIIDMYCYRRWGHNEADEPSFTQPLVYKAIEHRPSVRDSYLKHLLDLGKVTEQEAREIADQEHAELEKQFNEAKKPQTKSHSCSPSGVWQPFYGGRESDDGPDTGVPVERLKSLLAKLAQMPDGFHVHKKLLRSIERRQKMAAGEEPLDWSAAEALAFATLAVEGHPVRLAGQDSERGTFSQRHAVLHDIVDGRRYEIFQHLADDQAPVHIINSPLNEAGTMGFEYGYSLDYPEALVVWEAQYGDFVNAAQVIIDQFLVSAEDKWRRLSGLVLLLPHGFEGKGPEHSSARWERFLALAAEDNLQVVYPSTPAQYFHCLRRQVKRKWRMPLVVLTPKSLLRHPGVVSTLDELATGRFQRVLGDIVAGLPTEPLCAGSGDPRTTGPRTTSVLLTSGKIYYELVVAREKRKRFDVAIVRVEQHYPLRDELLAAALKNCPDGTPVRWVQEEPENMGAWPYWKNRFCGQLLKRYPFSVVARPASASPATGSSAAHHREQELLIGKAFEPTK
jgi:2-oxoglutarate dehydrogenase E1 component